MASPQLPMARQSTPKTIWKLAGWALGVLVAAGGCGKKGSPMAPIVRIPAQVDTIAARRVGSDVYVTLTVPKTNIDASTPADVSRIDVYGYTGVQPPPRARWTTLGTVVGSVPVVPAPEPGAPPAPPPDPAVGATQGAPVTIVDTLSADKLVQGPVDPPLPGRRGLPAPPPAAASAPPAMHRFYFAIPFSPRGRPGPPGASTDLTLAQVPAPPTDLAVTYDALGIHLAWDPSGGLVGFLLDREIPMEPAPFDDPSAAATAIAPAGPTRYNVYADVAPDPFDLPGPRPVAAPWRAAPPAPMNASPLAATTLNDTVEFERERCYAVRAVRGAAPNVAESDPTPRVCVRPIDVFPPAPPTGLAAVAGEGAISLIWEPSNDADAGGYLVLRGEAGDATLQPLTPAPIFDASYRDASVTAGKRYIYAVVAIDDRLPIGNMSAPSARVEETAR